MNYKKRAAFKSFHRRIHNRAVIIAHRRSGKTVLAVGDLFSAALRNADKHYAYISPFTKLTNAIAWEYAKDMIGTSYGIYNELKKTIKFENGSTVSFFGADNPESLRGMVFDGVIFDNAEDINSTVWSDIIQPALLEKQGWAVFIGTRGKFGLLGFAFQSALKDMGHWFVQVLPVSVTKLLSISSLLEYKAAVNEDTYEQEMECKP